MIRNSQRINKLKIKKIRIVKMEKNSIKHVSNESEMPGKEIGRMGKNKSVMTKETWPHDSRDRRRTPA